MIVPCPGKGPKKESTFLLLRGLYDPLEPAIGIGRWTGFEADDGKTRTKLELPPDRDAAFTALAADLS